jgi:hypothetical protein
LAAIKLPENKKGLTRGTHIEAVIAISDPTLLTNLLVKMWARSLIMPGVLCAYRLVMNGCHVEYLSAASVAVLAFLRIFLG